MLYLHVLLYQGNGKKKHAVYWSTKLLMNANLFTLTTLFDVLKLRQFEDH